MEVVPKHVVCAFRDQYEGVVLGASIRREGCRITLFSDGVQLRDYLLGTTDQVDAILADNVMIGMYGVDVMIEVQDLAKFARTLFFIRTKNPELANRNMIRRSGGIYVSSQATPKEVMDVITDALTK